MKLREVLANTLPRVKKSKRKHPVAQSPPESSESTSGGSTGHLSGRDCGSARDCINVVTCNKSLVTEDFRYLKDASTSTTPPPQTRRDPFNVNLNLQLHSTNSNCGCYQINGTRQYPSDDYSLSDTEFKGYTSGDGSDANYNTLPKARNRIRTNPWLPSPKTSPPMSPPTTPVTSPSSPITSSTTSPLHSAVTPMSLTPESGDSACMDTSFSASSDHSSVENFRIRPLRPTGGRDKRRKTKTTERFGKESSLDSLSDADSLLRQSCSSDMMDTSMSAGETLDQEPMLVGLIRGDQLTIDIQKGTISIHASEDVSSPISFEYEHALESTLESPGVGRFVGSRDSLNWANRDSCLLEDVHFHVNKQSTLRESDEEQVTDNAEVSTPRASVSEQQGSSCGSSGTLCCSDIPPKSPNLTDPPQDEVFDSYAADNNKENVHRLPEQESMDSGFSSTQLSDNQDGLSLVDTHGRTIGDIRSSLQEKVLRLRQEKRLVDEKIREAQEEERLRLHYISCFQSQATALLRQVLVDTLDRLKARLAQQSHRLQNCYDTVLQRQWTEARAKRQRTGAPDRV